MNSELASQRGSASRLVSPRQRVMTALRHEQPDRVPADFSAGPEVWSELVEHFDIDVSALGDADYFDPAREAVLCRLRTDCRVVSYDQFCRRPASAMHKGAEVDWWNAARPLPNRVWREQLPTGDSRDIWGRRFRMAYSALALREEFAGWPLGEATSIDDLRQYSWPRPDWWNFSGLGTLLARLDERCDYHIRFRAGSVFEIAWQLRGMQKFLLELAIDSRIPEYIMDRVADVVVEILSRVLKTWGDRLDMVLFYDDVATQDSLLISPVMWRRYVRPHHVRLVEVAKAYDKPVMYHCDGAIYPLIPELVDMGIDLLNPIQTDAAGMDPPRLKEEFGGRIAFHGGVDVVRTLPRSTTQGVRDKVRELVQVLGEGGGYILASTHHIQPDTPLRNVLAMYDPVLRV